MAEYGINIDKDTSECRSQWTEAVAEERNKEKKTKDDVEESRKPGKAPVKYAQEAGFGKERKEKAFC